MNRVKVSQNSVVESSFLFSEYFPVDIFVTKVADMVMVRMATRSESVESLEHELLDNWVGVNKTARSASLVSPTASLTSVQRSGSVSIGYSSLWQAFSADIAVVAVIGCGVDFETPLPEIKVIDRIAPLKNILNFLSLEKKLVRGELFHAEIV